MSVGADYLWAISCTSFGTADSSGLAGQHHVEGRVKLIRRYILVVVFGSWQCGATGIHFGRDPPPPLRRPSVKGWDRDCVCVVSKGKLVALLDAHVVTTYVITRT